MAQSYQLIAEGFLPRLSVARLDTAPLLKIHTYVHTYVRTYVYMCTIFNAGNNKNGYQLESLICLFLK